MATFVLIHGAGDVGWYWHLVEAELRARGHDTIAPDLPCDDDSAGLPEYANTVTGAIGDRTNLIVVAQSLGGFTAPLVCDRVAVELLILVAPMIPAPGEAPAGYCTHTRYDEEVLDRYDDTIALFYQDVSPELAAEALNRARSQAEARMEKRWSVTHGCCAWWSALVHIGRRLRNTGRADDHLRQSGAPHPRAHARPVPVWAATGHGVGSLQAMLAPAHGDPQRSANG